MKMGNSETTTIREVCETPVVLLDVMKILSELSVSFQQNKLYITDVVAKLETTLAMLEELKLQRSGHYRKFM